MVTKTVEQFSEAASQSVDSANEFIKTSLSSFEKITKLNIDASKKLLEETSEALKEFTEIKNPKDLFARVNSLATSSVEQNINNCRDLYEILTETQNKIGKLVEAQIQSAQQNVASAMENLSKFNPSKSNIATESVKNWVNGTNQALETFNKVASQVTEFTNNNIKAATTATANAAKKAATPK